jgi:hypothetical protein
VPTANLDRASSARTLLRGPLFAAFLLGCCTSLFVSGRLTARLAFTTGANLAFIPACEIVGLLAVVWGERRRVPIATLVDEFFVGNRVIYVGVIAGATAWAWTTARQPLPWTIPYPAPLWIAGGILVVLISALGDYHYFRALGGSAARSLGKLGIQRFVAWGLAFLYFLGHGALGRILS